MLFGLGCLPISHSFLVLRVTCSSTWAQNFSGHTGINFVIKEIHPIVVSVTLLLEPVIGSLIGFFVGVSAFPGMCKLHE